MNRAEKRRKDKAAAKSAKTATYNFTKEQIDAMIQSELDKRLELLREDCVADAMLLMFTLPMMVLMDNFWKKTYARKIPEFTELLLQYYQDWEGGKLDMNKMKEDLWVYGGIRLERNKG